MNGQRTGKKKKQEKSHLEKKNRINSKQSKMVETSSYVSVKIININWLNSPGKIPRDLENRFFLI